MCARVGFRIVGGNSLSRASVIHAQDAHRPGAKLAGEPSAVLGLHDVVGVVQADGGLEVAAVFNEKRPYLREVGRKALIRDGRIVDADLAEIGVDGGIEHQAVVQDELCIEPAIPLEMLVFEVRVGGVDGVYLPQVATQYIRFKLKVLAMLDIAETFGCHVLGQAAGDRMPVLWPEGLFVGVGNIPLQDNAPGPRLAWISLLEIKAGEGDAHEHHVSERRAFAPGVPHGIKRVVGGVLLAVKPIALNAEGIAVEHEGPSLIVKSIQHHLDKIIISERIASQHMRADKPWRLVFANERGKKIFAGVTQIGDGRFGDRPAILGITLDEVADAQHLFCCRRARDPA